MKLTYNGLLNKAYWQERGYQLPLYDIPRVRAATLTAPRWLHLGAGNIFRAFLANLQQRLLDQRDAETGIIVAEGYDEKSSRKPTAPTTTSASTSALKATAASTKSSSPASSNR